MNAKLRAAVLLSGLLVAAQDKAAKVKFDDFEGEDPKWTALKLETTGTVGEDADAKVAVTHDAKHVKAGKGALAYSYELVPGTIRVLALPRAADLAGMKSLRLWVKSSHATAVIIGLSENGGATYQTSAACAAGTWQEVAVNLDEFTPDDPAKDGNGKLDLDEVGSFQVFDIACFLATLLPDLKGERSLWLDEISFSAKAVAQTTGFAQVTKVVPVFLVDTFEGPVVRWSPISLEFSETPKFNLFDAPASIDSIAPAGGGKQSLKFAYPRKGAKVHGLIRSLEKIDLSKAAGLDLTLKTFADGTFVVGVEEKDGSRYQQVFELKAADGWKALSLGFGSLSLADDSQDENGKLDAGDIKQIAIADITTLAGGQEVDENRLWVDQVQFSLNP